MRMGHTHSIAQSAAAARGDRVDEQVEGRCFDFDSCAKAAKAAKESSRVTDTA